MAALGRAAALGLALCLLLLAASPLAGLLPAGCRAPGLREETTKSIYKSLEVINTRCSLVQIHPGHSRHADVTDADADNGVSLSALPADVT